MGERSLDSDDDLVVRFARDLRLLREKAGSPTYRALSARTDYSAAALSEAASGRKLPTLSAALAYVAGCGGDIAEWEARWRRIAAELSAGKGDSPREKDDDGPAPYLGLAAFQQEDKGRFFGRDRLITDLLARLRRHRFLGVFGPSGCGKSSLLRAGLAARLAAEGGLPVMVFTPGVHPLEECATRVASFLGESPVRLRDEFTMDPRNLHLRIRQAATGSAAGSDVVLVVDQFEELFTLCADEQERTAFIDALVTAATDPASRTRVVLGVRADFLGHCGQNPTLVAALYDRQLLVGAMTTDELRLAITGPAQQTGYRVETALVARLVADAGRQPGMLPLVSHALLQTWQRRQGKVMTLAGYEAVGGIEHAVSRTAEQTYQAFDTAQQDIVQQVFLRLTALGEETEDTKRRVVRDELDYDDLNTTLVLDTLARTRLVTVGDDSVEIAHEALIRHWPRLRSWLTDDREGHRLHRHLTNAATEWEQHQRDEGLLYRGLRLAAWQDRPLTQLNETEHAYLTASRHGVERERTARVRRLRRLLVAMGVVAAVVSVLVGLAVVQSSRAAEERDVAFSRQLATNARSQLQVDPELALLLATEAVEVAPTEEADAALRQAVADSRARATLRTGDDRVWAVAISPDGRRIATGSNFGGSLRVWERSGSSDAWSTRPVLVAAKTAVWDAAFSPDGRYLAAVTNEEPSIGPDRVQVWDMDHAGKPVTLRDQSADVPDIAYSPDGQQIIVGADNGVWSLDPAGHRDPVLLHVHDGEAAPVWGSSLSPDGRYVASYREDEIWVEDLTGQQKPVKLKLLKREMGSGIAFSPDGRRVAAANGDGVVQVWNPVDGTELTRIQAQEGSVISLEFSPDGYSLVSTGDDGTVRVINSVGGTNPLILRGHRGLVMTAIFSPDGRWIASGGEDGTLRIWSASSSEGMTFREHTGAARTAAFTPDALHIVSGGDDGTVRIRDGDGAHPAILNRHSAGITDVDVGPDGRLIASVSRNGELFVWDRSTNSTQLATWKSSNTESQIDGSAGVEIVSGSRILTSAYGDLGRNIEIWNTDGSSRQLLSKNSAKDVYELADMAISSDERYIAISTNYGGVRVWPFTGSGEKAEIELPRSRGRVTDLAFALDGHRLATGEMDGTVWIYPVDGDGEPLRLYGQQNELTGIAYSPDGRHLATSGSDGTVHIWDTAGNGEPVLYHDYQASVESVTFSPDGRYLLTTHDDGTVRTRECDVCGTTRQTLEIAKSHTTRQLTADEKKTFGLTQR